MQSLPLFVFSPISLFAFNSSTAYHTWKKNSWKKKKKKETIYCCLLEK